MRRTFALLLLLCSFLWNASAVASQGFATASEEVQHALLHAQATGHHHDDHGAYHEDDSDASMQHVVLDALLGAPALWSTPPALCVASPATPRPDAADESAPPSPFVEGVRRPPRPTT